MLLNPTSLFPNQEICGCCGARGNGIYSYENVGVNLTISETKVTGESDDARFVSVPMGGFFINLKLRKEQPGDRDSKEEDEEDE